MGYSVPIEACGNVQSRCADDFLKPQATDELWCFALVACKTMPSKMIPAMRTIFKHPKMYSIRPYSRNDRVLVKPITVRQAATDTAGR